MHIWNLNSLKILFFCRLAIIYLFGRFCLDKLWVDPVGRGDHLWDRLDFFVLLTGEPKQYVLLTVLGLQELPEGYLSGWKSQMTVSRERVYIQSSICTIRIDSHLYNRGLCPQTHSKSQHPPVGPWESNTIYPWKEHQDLSLAQ